MTCSKVVVANFLNMVWWLMVVVHHNCEGYQFGSLTSSMMKVSFVFSSR